LIIVPVGRFLFGIQQEKSSALRIAMKADQESGGAA
jgi:hypothetical protein